MAIAEQHAVTFAAGLAIGGYKPVVAIYSTFLQRAYDQLIHDVAIQNLPVMFAIDRGGIVGADGQTHQGRSILSFMRCIPTMVIMTPSDENECRQMLYTGYHYNAGLSAVRYPRGTGTGAALEPLSLLPIGKGVVRRQGKDRHSQLRHPAAGGRASGGSAQRHAGRHALRQTAGRAAGARTGRQP